MNVDTAAAMAPDTYAPFAEYYDIEYDAFDADLDFYRQFARQANGPILELGCGTGRVLRALAELALPLTGIDNSAAMLDRARTRLSTDVRLVLADVRCVVPAQLPNAPYWMAFSAINSWLHLPDADAQLDALRAVRAVVVSGGLLLLDLMVPEPHYLAALDGRLTCEFSTTLPDGDRLDKLVSRTHDLASQTISTTVYYDRTHASTGQLNRAVGRYDTRYVHRFELEHLLERAGWRLISLYGSYDLDPYGADAERMLALATWGSASDDVKG
jgi:SAM-dependent methyltransferase